VVAAGTADATIEQRAPVAQPSSCSAVLPRRRVGDAREASSTEDDTNPMRGAVVSERYACVASCQRGSVEFYRCDPPTDTVRVLADDVVGGAVISEVDLVAGQARGMHGSSMRCVPRSRKPRIHSTPAWYIQAADPLYQVHPPRPTCGGSE
jgi:hypothetical protein